ncbi:LTA synthase family protein [Nocardioides albidus]|uniref:LTA synthase family protein n=1 Tax=Nocardioides albidus TaxID=1517589 RepID=A0A5C4VX59_9ACTN|nr:LTA synthase family protein [Nocardioides albidus]TNM40514.1 LTA synthase family protein [Nocardioides albidus]
MSSRKSQAQRAQRATRAAQYRAAAQRAAQEAAVVLAREAVGAPAGPAGGGSPAPGPRRRPSAAGAAGAAAGRVLPTPAVVVLVLLVVKLEVFRLVVWGAPQPAMLVADVAAAAVLVGLVGLVAPSRWAGVAAFWAVNLAVTALIVCSLVYAGWFRTLPTWSALGAADQAGEVAGSITEIFQPWYLALVADFLLAPVVRMVLRRRGFARRPADRWRDRSRRFGAVLAVGVVVSAVLVHGQAGVRNQDYVAESLGLLSYEAWALTRGVTATSRHVDLDTVYGRVTALKERHNGPIPAPDAAAHFGEARDMNLVVVQLEALQNVVVGLSVDGQQVTPNLDRLIEESYYFSRHFQQIGKGNTADAEFMSNTSLYPVGDVATSEAYGDRALPSLPKLLKARGYAAETFHVNTASFWDRDQLYPALGFDRWHQREEFVNDHFNQWGGSDESLYATGLDRLTELAAAGRPFYAQFVTASGHHPFVVPEDEVGLVLPAALEGSPTGRYLQAQNYADRALGTFIDGLEERGLRDDTMLVAYGDHFGLSAPGTVEAMTALGADYTWNDRFNVPLVVHVPGQTPAEIDRVGGQVDIMPTIANLMGIGLDDERFVYFGSDLLNTDAHTFGERGYQPEGTFLNDDVWFVPGRGFEDGAAVDLDDMSPVDAGPYRADYDYVIDLMDLSDAYLASLPER